MPDVHSLPHRCMASTKHNQPDCSTIAIDEGLYSTHAVPYTPSQEKLLDASAPAPIGIPLFIATARYTVRLQCSSGTRHTAAQHHIPFTHITASMPHILATLDPAWLWLGGILGLYLYDALLVLAGNEWLLLCHGQRWQAIWPSDRWRWFGQRLWLPLPWRPDVPALRVIWQPHISTGAPHHTTDMLHAAHTATAVSPLHHNTHQPETATPLNLHPQRASDMHHTPHHTLQPLHTASAADKQNSYSTSSAVPQLQNNECPHPTNTDQASSPPHYGIRTCQYCPYPSTHP